MTKEFKWIIAAIIFNLALTIAVGIMVVANNPGGTFGISGMRVEDYIPVIRENAGYYSDEPIYTTDTLRAGDAVTFDSTLAVTGAITLTGTTSVEKSYDGFSADCSFTMSTGTAKCVKQNLSGKPWKCEPKEGLIFADSLSTTLGAQIAVSIGTTTDATSYTVGLLASTTVATTTDTVISLNQLAPFILAHGSAFVGQLSDLNGNVSSSTYYGSSYWDFDFSIPCTMIDP